MKQTLDRARLRCRTASRVLVELDWSILALAVAELFAWKEQRSRRQADPTHRSLAGTMRVLWTAIRYPTQRPADGDDVSSRLRDAVKDEYVRRRAKGSRYRPKNPDKKPLGDPKVRRLTADEKTKLQEIQQKQRE